MRLFMLSLSVPSGFAVGRLIYLRRSHVEIYFDDMEFQVTKGSKKIAGGKWSAHNAVSIVLDSFRRPSLRLYKELDGETVDIPIYRAGVNPQEFRDSVQQLLSNGRIKLSSLQAAEAS